MAKQRKPFISRKRKREMEEARVRREVFMEKQAEGRRLADLVVDRKDEPPVDVPPTLTVGELAIRLELPVTRVIGQLVKSGVMASINDRLDFDTMAIVADELGVAVRPAATTTATPTDEELATGSEAMTAPRAPIVTFMGHVDHGKTSILDVIRQTSVAAKEAGGITQHIGAYQAEVESGGRQRTITFLDTPGHEAFSALRSHGAHVTDIVVLVVAADDGVKPQTIEAITHAKAAAVPIIVAINKIDLLDANAEQAMRQLADHGLVAEAWGGSTIVVPVSAKTGEGISNLLEYILLLADLKQLRANPAALAQGVVIESHQQSGMGPMATLLVQNGTLKRGDFVIIGASYGRVRTLNDWRGQPVAESAPATPAVISGLPMVRSFGEGFVAVATEKEAKAHTHDRQTPIVRQGIEVISKAIAEGRANALALVLKADTQGSLEALKTAIGAIQIPGVKAHVIHTGIGDVTLSDVQLAAAAAAVIMGFHIGVPATIKKAAQTAGVTVAPFTIIYDLINRVELALRGRVKVTRVAVEVGRLKVKKIFRVTRASAIVGGEITSGVARANTIVTVVRAGQTIAQGTVNSVHKGPAAVSELPAGQDCGVALQIKNKIDPGDTLIFSAEEEVVAESDPTAVG